jgi:hypothetical protein
MAAGDDGAAGDAEQWEALIWEFESRSAAAQRAGPASAVEEDDSRVRGLPKRPSGRRLGRENPEQYESLNQVEAAAATAATAFLWFCGRLLRMDSFLVLFYPLPSLVIMMRWGPRYGNAMFLTTSLLILTLMGPLFAFLFTMNTGLLILAFGNALWYQWHWSLTILAGCAAKFAGLFVNVSLTSAMLRYNAWQLMGEQVKGMIDQAGALFFRAFGNGRTFAGPSMGQVRLGIAFLLAVHSLFQVVFTHLSATMILDRLHGQGATARAPKLLPLLSVIKRLANKQFDDLRAHPYKRPVSGARGTVQSREQVDL